MSRPRVSVPLGAVASLALAALVLGGCGAAEDRGRPGDGGSATPRGGDEPITPRALAAVVAEHTGEPSSAGPSSDLEELGDGVVAAVELRYAGGEESDGASLTVGVGTGFDAVAPGCRELRDEGVTGCEEVPEGLLFWEGAVPEEDPGVVYLLSSKGRTDVLLFTSGGPVTGDPRDLDLPVDVEELAAVAADPRVDVTTSRAALEAGEDLASWPESPS